MIVKIILAWFPVEMWSDCLSPATFNSRLGFSVILSIHLSEEHRWPDRDWRYKLPPHIREEPQSSLGTALSVPRLPKACTLPTTAHLLREWSRGLNGGKAGEQATWSVRDFYPINSGSFFNYRTSKHSWQLILILSCTVTVTWSSPRM